jgi:hypothetical protein
MAALEPQPPCHGDPLQPGACGVAHAARHDQHVAEQEVRVRQLPGRPACLDSAAGVEDALDGLVGTPEVAQVPARDGARAERLALVPDRLRNGDRLLADFE